MKKYKILSISSLLLLLTTLLSYGFFAIYNFGINPITELSELASGFKFIIPTPYFQLIDNLKEYSNILTNIQHDIVIVYAAVWAGLTIGILLIFVLVNYIVKRKKNPVFSLMFAFIVSCYLSYFSFSNFINTIPSVSRFLFVTINFGLIFIVSIIAIIIYGFEIYKKLKNIKLYHIEIVVNKLFKLALMLILIIIGLKVVGQITSFYVLTLVVDQIDFASWISVSDLFSNFTNNALLGLVPPVIVKAIDTTLQNTGGISVLNDISNVAIDSLADKYVLNNLTAVVQNFIMNLFRPIIFNNVYYYIALIVATIFGLNLKILSKVPINYFVSVSKIIVSLFLIIVFGIKASGFYVFYINLILAIVIVYYIIYIIYDMKLLQKLFKKEKNVITSNFES